VDNPQLFNLLESFTNGGTPLPALIGTKQEMRVTILVAALISNDSVCSKSEPTELIDAAIAYSNLIEERLGIYQNQQVHSLERLLET
jgi:hypothetical protein